MNDISKRLRTAWASYRMLLTGQTIPKDLWDWMSDEMPDLYSQVLDCWCDFMRTWRLYVDGRLTQESFDTMLLRWGRLLLHCVTAYQLGHGEEPPATRFNRCRDCRHFQPLLQDLNDHTWGTCARDDNGTLIWSLSGCPGWTPKKEPSPSKKQ